MNSQPDAPEPVLLIIADISGYTRYMTANAKTLAHSQTLITELFNTLLQQIELPLEVVELEGDAVFMVCRKRNHSPWSESKRLVGDKLLTCFRLFREKIVELSRSTTCACHACAHIETLRLKIIIHSGEAVFYRVLNFVKPAGADVILVHRLLKNSVAAREYLLLTEAARQELQFPEAMVFKASSETYENFGCIKTEFHDLDLDASPTPAAGGNNFGARYRESLRLYLKLWFGPFWGRAKFRNLPVNSNRPVQVGFALLTAVLTPIMLPVAAVLLVFHALKSAR